MRGQKNEHIAFQEPEVQETPEHLQEEIHILWAAVPELSHQHSTQVLLGVQVVPLCASVCPWVLVLAESKLFFPNALDPRAQCSASSFLHLLGPGLWLP